MTTAHQANPSLPNSQSKRSRAKSSARHAWSPCNRLHKWVRPLWRAEARFLIADDRRDGEIAKIGQLGQRLHAIVVDGRFIHAHERQIRHRRDERKNVIRHLRPAQAEVRQLRWVARPAEKSQRVASPFDFARFQHAKHLRRVFSLRLFRIARGNRLRGWLSSRLGCLGTSRGMAGHKGDQRE